MHQFPGEPVPIRPALFVLPALLAAACAAPEWHRPGAPPDQVREDFAACRAAAAERMARAAAPAAPQVQLDPRFGATDPYRPAERRLEEERLVDACMREKGYTLAPAPR
jgi:hypothetical protein